jgi:Arc/MetJ-type ribon-helix-helix transcriptional regulator
MTVHLTPEHEQFVEEALRSGQFRSVDELLARALDEFRQHSTPAVSRPKESFAQFLRRSPLFGAGLDLERDNDLGRDITL